MSLDNFGSFAERVADYAECVPTPTPIELVLFAVRVAEKHEIDLAALAKQELEDIAE